MIHVMFVSSLIVDRVCFVSVANRIYFPTAGLQLTDLAGLHVPKEQFFLLFEQFFFFLLTHSEIKAFSHSILKRLLLFICSIYLTVAEALISE